MNVFLKLALVDFDVLIGDDFGYFGLAETHAHDFQGILRRLTVGEFLLSVLEIEKIHVVRVAEAAHGSTGVIVGSGLNEDILIQTGTVPDCLQTFVDLVVVFAGQHVTIKLIIDTLDFFVIGEAMVIVL